MPWFWGALLGAPLFVVSGQGAWRLLKRLRKAAKENSSSPGARARAALSQAKLDHKSGDLRALASSLERALHEAIEAKTGLKSRAVLRDKLTAKLEEAGLGALSVQARDLLDRCDSVRFVGDGADSGAIFQQGKSLVEAILSARVSTSEKSSTDAKAAGRLS